MNILRQILIIAAVAWVSECIALALPFPFPSSVIAMLLLLALLLAGAVKTSSIRDVTALLTGELSFFFIPASINIINYVAEIKSALIPFILVCTLVTVLTFAVTAYVTTLVMHAMGSNQNEEG